MLGWEFPPFFSGGLGVATYGIVNALRHKADIRLIIPTCEGSSSLSNVSIIGLDSIGRAQAAHEQGPFPLDEIATEVHRLSLPLSPYQYINELLQSPSTAESKETSFRPENLPLIQSLFSDKDVYGVNMRIKVDLYTQLATQISAEKNFDVIHAHDWITFAAGLKIKSNSHRPLVLHIHSLETDRAGESVRNEIYEIEKHAMHEADRVISVSQYTKDQIIKHYAIDPEKITVVHNGITPDIKRKVPHVLRDKLVIFLGRITHQKGPEFLLETAEKVSRVYERVKFIVAGTGDEFAKLLESSAYKKMGNKFIFAGFLSKEKVDELFSMADVYFMPSVSEPFGITALEAVQHHIPSVLSNQSGVGEVIRASLHADFWDTDKYANYLYALLKYDALGHTLSMQAAEELNSLTWEHTADKIWNIYQGILANHSN